MALEQLQVLEGHTDRVWSVSWSPEGDVLASCSGDKTVRIWHKQPESESWVCTAKLTDAHTRTIRACSWAPNGRQLAMASFDGITSIWQLQGGVWEQVSTLEGHENEVKCVAWSPCGNFIATCGRDRTVWLWETLPGHEYSCADVKHGHGADVKAVVWHPSRELLVSCSYDDTIKLWTSDGEDWECADTLEGHGSTVWQVAFSRDGTSMASCSEDRSVHIWSCSFAGDTPVLKLVSALTGYHDRAVYSVDWAAGDESIIATGDGTNAIKVFSAVHAGLSNGADAPSGSSWSLLCTKSQAHEQDINCVRWHPTDPNLLASASDDGKIKLWRFKPATDDPMLR